MNIAFQGEPGAYSEAAIFEHYGTQGVTTLPARLSSACSEAVSGEEGDLGFIPIENSLAGSIHQNYDLLLRHALWVVGEHNPARQPLPDWPAGCERAESRR